MNKEYIGIISSLLVIVSLTIPLNTTRRQTIMRVLNNLGSVGFIIYGIVLPAYSTAFLNLFALLVNTYHIIKTRKDS